MTNFNNGAGALPTTLIAAWGNSETISYHGIQSAKGAVVVFGGEDSSDVDPLRELKSNPGVSFFDVTTVTAVAASSFCPHLPSLRGCVGLLRRVVVDLSRGRIRCRKHSGQSRTTVDSTTFRLRCVQENTCETSARCSRWTSETREQFTLSPIHLQTKLYASPDIVYVLNMYINLPLVYILI